MTHNVQINLRRKRRINSPRAVVETSDDLVGDTHVAEGAGLRNMLGQPL